MYIYMYLYPVQMAVVYVEFAVLASRKVVDIFDKVFDSTT